MTKIQLQNLNQTSAAQSQYWKLLALYSYLDICMDHISPSKQQKNIVQLCTSLGPPLEQHRCKREKRKTKNKKYSSFPDPCCALRYYPALEAADKVRKMMTRMMGAMMMGTMMGAMMGTRIVIKMVRKTLRWQQICILQR